MEKPWYKRWQVWLGVVVALGLLGAILPEPPENKKVVDSQAKEEVVKDASEEKTQTNTPETKPEPVEIKPLTKDEVLSKFEVDSDIKPYIDGQFTFDGNRSDTADYYALADTDKYRNASVIFKDGQIAKVKLIPAENQDVGKLFEEFGITEEPRKLSGYAGAYEVALIPMYWSQNIERYPFELD
ncbi:hypothetical protein [Lysinibacillus sp. TE18511]